MWMLCIFVVMNDGVVFCNGVSDVLFCCFPLWGLQRCETVDLVHLFDTYPHVLAIAEFECLLII